MIAVSHHLPGQIHHLAQAQVTAQRVAVLRVHQGHLNRKLPKESGAESLSDRGTENLSESGTESLSEIGTVSLSESGTETPTESGIVGLSENGIEIPSESGIRNEVTMKMVLNPHAHQIRGNIN